jgi:hypothetical protein
MLLAPQIIRVCDANRDGRVSPAEAGKAAARLVRNADTKKKGSIDTDALAATIQRFLPPPPPGGFPGRGGPGGPGVFPGGAVGPGGAPKLAGPGGPGAPGGPPGGFGGPAGQAGGPGRPPGGFGPGGPGAAPGQAGLPGGFNLAKTLAEQIMKVADTDEDDRLSPTEAATAAERFVREADVRKKGSLDSAALALALNRILMPPGAAGPPGAAAQPGEQRAAPQGAGPAEKGARKVEGDK